MPTPGDCFALVLPLALVCCLVTVLPVRGEMCSAVIRAAAGDDVTVLRDKAFTAFKAECRMEKEHQPANINSCSFDTQPRYPQRFTFILIPLTMPFRLVFEVRCERDPFLALADNTTEESVFAEIHIGGFINKKSGIRACHTESDTCQRFDGAVYEEVGIVSGNESRPFWVEYREGVVSVGKGGQEEAFMEWDAGAYHGRVPTRVRVGIASWQVAPAYWVFYQFCW